MAGFPDKFKLLLLLLVSACSLWPAAAVGGQSDRECVVLLHGLARTSASMTELETKLETAGYAIVNLSYPSRNFPVEELARSAVEEGLAACDSLGTSRVNFVTHSLGSILVRYYFGRNEDPRLHRVVMLGPPNQGSELVDALAELPGFELINGPSGEQLGTGSQSIVQELGPVNFDTGVIAGDQGINPLFAFIIPGPDDGKVSVSSTRVEGMKDHIVLPVTHTFMMFNNEVVDQVIHFLKSGQFDRPDP